VTLRPFEALLCVLAALLGLLAIGPLLVDRLGLLGIAVSEVGLVGLPTVAFLQARGLPVAAALGLDRVQARTLCGAIFAGAGAFWIVALLESVVLERVLPVPPSLRESLRRMVVPGAGPRLLAADVLALALAPALCEEALFRGLLLPALLPRGRAVAIGVTALTFASFHFSIYRFLPTALLGVVLGLVRVASGSLWPAIAFHAVNNVLVIAMVRLGRDAPPLPPRPLGTLGLGAAVITLAIGWTLVSPRAQRS
jgi:sodium transport system permease protein